MSDFASYLTCLSVLEERVFTLYQNLADKVDPKLPKSLLLTLSTDSHKHSIILKGVAESIAEVKVNPKECEKYLGAIWRLNENFLKEYGTKAKLGTDELAQLSERLVVLEGSLGEEYYIFVQAQTLEQLSKEINQVYNIELSNLAGIFENIIKDEERHRETLGTIRKLLASKKTSITDTVPFVKYQNPDSWSHSLPSTTQDSY